MKTTKKIPVYIKNINNQKIMFMDKSKKIWNKKIWNR